MKAIRVVWLAAMCAAMGTTNTRATAAVSAADVSVVCTPASAGTFPSRVQVRCTQSFSGIAVFAAPATDPAAAARYASMATSALIAGRSLRIHYDPADQTGGAIGCPPAECRLLRGLEIF